MTHRRAFALLFALALLVGTMLASPETAHADDCRVGRTPEGVFPVSDPDIVMVDEDVTVRLDAALPEWSSVECIFAFENQGPAKEVVMGFPGTMDLEDDWSSKERMELSELSASIRRDGDTAWQEATVEREAGVSPPGELPGTPRYDFWYTFPVRFGSGERLQVRNVYRAANSMWSNDSVGTGYVISTGQSWKGNIGRARVTFDLGGVPLHSIIDMFPGTFRVERSRLVWEASDFEPFFDLRVWFNTREYKEEAISAMGEEFRRAVEQERAVFDAVEALDPARDAARLMEMLESARARNRLALAGFIGTRLNERPGHPPQFGTVFVETRDGSRYLRATLSDLGADVVHFEGMIVYGRSPPFVVTSTWSWDSTQGFFSRDVGTGLSESVDPLKEYLVRLAARDSAGNETRSALLLRGDRVYPAGEKRPVPWAAAALVGASALAAGIIGWGRISRGRHARESH